MGNRGTWAVGIAATIVLVSGVLAVLVSDPAGTTRPPSAGPTSTSSPSSSATGGTALRDPAVAVTIPAERLLELADERDLGSSPMPLDDSDIPTQGRPIYVVDATVDRERAEVRFDLVLAFRPRVELSAVPLYLAALRHAAGVPDAEPELTVTRDGTDVHVGHRYALGLMLAQLDPPVQPGEVVRLRIQGSYTVPEVSELQLPETAADPFPAFLSRSGDSLLLLGWLPTLVLGDQGGHTPTPGRAGRSPPSRWSATVRGAPHLASSGTDRPCGAGEDATGCTWVVADALTDLSAIATEELPSVSRTSGGVELRLAGPPGSDGLEALAAIAAASYDGLAGDLGPLPWAEVDLVPASISDLDIIGLSTPGLVFLEEDVYDAPRDPLARQLVAHELAHQWFGALVSTDTDGAALIHESAAQYLAYVELARHEGQGLADRFAGALRAYYLEVMRPIDRLQEPPADPAFDLGPEARSALWYGRGALGWMAAERTAGRDRVLGTLADIVDRHRFGFVELEDVRSIAPSEVESVLEAYWFEYGPIPD